MFVATWKHDLEQGLISPFSQVSGLMAAATGTRGRKWRCRIRMEVEIKHAAAYWISLRGLTRLLELTRDLCDQKRPITLIVKPQSASRVEMLAEVRAIWSRSCVTV